MWSHTGAEKDILTVSLSYSVSLFRIEISQTYRIYIDHFIAILCL